MSVVPFDNQSNTNSFIHKCLGKDNKYHDAKNSYSVSALCGGKMDEKTKTLNFVDGGFIIVSSLDNDFMDKIITGVMRNSNLGFGMKFTGIDFVQENFHNGWNHFATLTPFIIKEYSDKNNYSFTTLNDDDFQQKVKSYLINKLSKINKTLRLDDFDVKITPHQSHKVKSILVKNVINRASQCHISIHTNKKVAELLYNIGIGQSTGSGFGTIYKTENKSMYSKESQTPYEKQESKNLVPIS